MQALRLTQNLTSLRTPFLRGCSTRFRNLREKSTTSGSSTAEITTLGNGIRVATENTPGHFSAVGVYVDAGSRYETEETRGVSHLLDRIAFKSTANKSTEEITSELEALGGNVMCSSSRECMMYQASIFNQDLERVVSLFSEVVQNPIIDPQELDEQRQSTFYEISDIWSKPESILPELLHITAYKNNTLGNPLLCPEKNLVSMTPETIKKYLHQWYTPERIVVAAAGAPHDEVCRLAEKYFGNMKQKAPEEPSKLASLFGKKSPADEKAKYTGGTLMRENLELPFTNVYLGFEGVSIHDPDVYPLATLQILMGGGSSFSAGGPGKGMYSRFYTNILNQHYWVESCQSFNHCYTDSGLFGVAASCRPEYNQHLIYFVGQELELITRTGRGGISEVEMNRAKNQLKSSLLMNLESRMIQLEDLGRQVQIRGHKVEAEEMCDLIDQVTLADLCRVANRVLKDGKGDITFVAEGNLTGLNDYKKLLKLP
ncbi:hypothetical protein K493DRAFT_292010 [Basidiobolus meristosporus CBS 931.73]|uniref:LuxS/MPP-like metallohydrolase n=1 Tax=Basidiobolus meristosporus CBS 931.73 TaxID=1314790 RepID=A0A1Y1XCE9_9FUNG|nr:hypothetical protein K493DRAFT_293373 [Basidiobolus meristosporus CBS 931.73]ORX83393.1 hypothetical protein K493DRAFT_292010 [Basidiobolus meristosporus CBS 931.73]|eukprot:ORX79313.1 hypothetical protein K493DRAFT_293373 [Basidiobolus meristosporus CBS 931.73]